MLTHVEITNYKSIASCSLSLLAENVIVGQNGIGKSNLLDALHFIRDAVSGGLDQAITKRHGINSVRRWSKTRPYNVSIKINFRTDNGHGDYRIVIASGKGDFWVVEEEANWWGANKLAINSSDEIFNFKFHRSEGNGVLITAPNEPFGAVQAPPALIPRSELIMSQVAQSRYGVLSYFMMDLANEITSFGAYSIYPNKIREPQVISNLEVLSDDGSNLASIIRRMRSTTFRGNRESLTQAMKQVLPILTEIRIESAGGFYVPVFRVKETENSAPHDLNMSQISDGTLRMLGMLVAFYQPKAPMKIAIEEPEQMIHPGLLPVLIESARDYVSSSGFNSQFFTTTHSPNFLDSFDPMSIIGGTFEGGISKFFHLSERQVKIIKEGLYTPGELMVVEGLSLQ